MASNGPAVNRREFLQTLGILCGGLTLASCGNSGGGGVDGGFAGPVVPSAWRYFPLISTDDALAQGDPGPASFPGWAMLNQRSQVLFQVYDRNKATALYLADLDFSAGAPRLAQLQKILRDGDTTADGEVIQRVEACCLNNRGDVAVRVMTTKGFQRIYLALAGQPLNPEVKFGDSAPGVENGRFAQSLGDFELLDDGSLVLVGHYYTSKYAAQGLFHLHPAGGSLLSSTRDTIPNSTSRIGVLGLLDVRDSTYTHQATAHGNVNANPTLVLLGDLREPQVRPRVLAASESIVMPQRVRAQMVTADAHYGPRLTSGGAVVTVVHSGSQSRLALGTQTLLESGQTTPSGAVISGFLGPLQTEADSVFVTALTSSGGSELLLVSPAGLRVLANEDFPLNGRLVRRWGLGAVRRQTDGFRFVCSAHYHDGASSLVLGLPV